MKLPASGELYIPRRPRKNFSHATKKEAWERCGGQCEGMVNGERCPNRFTAANPPEYDHADEDWEGGDVSLENCRVLGKKCCHRPKTSAATTRRAKADRIYEKRAGLTTKRSWWPQRRETR